MALSIKNDSLKQRQIIHQDVSWKQELRTIMSAALLCCCITLMKQLVVHCIRISCHKRKVHEDPPNKEVMDTVARYYCISELCPPSEKGLACEKHSREFQKIVSDKVITSLLSKDWLINVFAGAFPDSTPESTANAICRFHRQRLQLDVMQAIDDLSGLLNFVVLIVCCIVLSRF
jgi:hypothetical protein